MKILQFSTRRAFGIGALTLLVATPVLAQSQGRGGGPRYDPATEGTVTGTIDSLEQIAVPGSGRGRRGITSPPPLPPTNARVK